MNEENRELINIENCAYCGNQPEHGIVEYSVQTVYICECVVCGYAVYDIEKSEAIEKWNKINLFDKVKTLYLANNGDHEKLVQLIERINRIEFGGVK